MQNVSDIKHFSIVLEGNEQIGSSFEAIYSDDTEHVIYEDSPVEVERNAAG